MTDLVPENHIPIKIISSEPLAPKGTIPINIVETKSLEPEKVVRHVVMDGAVIDAFATMKRNALSAYPSVLILYGPPNQSGDTREVAGAVEVRVKQSEVREALKIAREALSEQGMANQVMIGMGVFPGYLEWARSYLNSINGLDLYCAQGTELISRDAIITGQTTEINIPLSQVSVWVRDASGEPTKIPPENIQLK